MTRHLILPGLLFLLAACGGAQVATPSASNGSTDATAATSAATSAATATGITASNTEIAPITALDAEQTQPPVRLQIPEIGLDVEVVEMGWQVVMVNGERTTRWTVPATGVGWHANSTGAGGAGNTILSGRQIGTDAALTALALGEIEPGHTAFLTDRDGIVFVYRIVEISDPIPAAGATDADLAQTMAYFEIGESPRLTLATGWPEFTTTHRIFAVGELEGVAR